MISKTAPHYLLLTQAQTNPHTSQAVPRGGVWRFVLEEMGGNQRIEVTETEPGIWGERLQLLAVVRGLEALEQPARVTLITPSRFVGNGIRVNLNLWRENDWQWEHFGEMIPIKNVDLWKRIDRALQFHQLDCRIWDFDLPAESAEPVPANPRITNHQLSQRRRITFEQIQQGRNMTPQRNDGSIGSSIKIKPLGRGRAFGLCNASELSTVSYTG